MEHAAPNVRVFGGTAAPNVRECQVEDAAPNVKECQVERAAPNVTECQVELRHIMRRNVRWLCGTHVM